MKTGWIIYRKADTLGNEGYIQWFIDEAQKQDIELKFVMREQLSVGIIDNKTEILKNGKPERPDFAIIRTIEPLLNLHFETAGIPAFNSYEVSRIANDKALAHSYVQQLGVPMNDTLFLHTDLLKQTPPLEFPFVLKQTGGRGGKEVYWIGSQDDWTSLLPKLPPVNLIAQRTNVRHGKDLRVFVVGDEVVGAVLRESDADFRANFKLGGKATFYNLNANNLEPVQKIIDRFDFGMVGIDFLIGNDGKLLFNEIEDIVGSRTLSVTSNINILEKYVALIRERIE
ncbi:hypothetical protein QR721_08535 [Aciduricibacillus chroicocephali]|uniref:ATP-grasp domain-containing protein n=1 Tax=Aciduricibacillus chroicocephali TaxID=3054939 RepID=A0ABY9KS96_9BACI|nr:hypothetical protein QR721_08535 [Bacillaceae bacterium 44XB]